MSYKKPNESEESEESLLEGRQVAARWNESHWSQRRVWLALLTASNVVILMISVFVFTKSQHNVEKSWLRDTSYYCEYH